MNKINIKKEDLVKLYVDKNLKDIEIASIYNCSDVFISRLRRSYGIKTRSQFERSMSSKNVSVSIEDLDDTTFTELYYSLTLKQISSKFSCSTFKIKFEVKKRGILLKRFGKKVSIPEKNKMDSFTKKISVDDLEYYYNLILNNPEIVKKWEDLLANGFPYPEVSQPLWDKRFLKLAKGKETTYNKENTAILCSIFYPQMFNHLLEVFNDAPKVIANRLRYAERITKGSLLTGLKLLSKETRTNFSPLIAKITLDTLCEGKQCSVLDYSMGFGGRLLGTLSSELGHTYYGIEPWIANINSSKELLKAIDRNIPGSSARCHTYNCGSEDYIPELNNKIDIAFSSPPYFNYEKYVKEETQSYIKYPIYSEWLKGYWMETVKNLKSYLKKNGILALNIKNIKKYNLEEDMCRIILEEGFVLKDTFEYRLHGRMGNFNKTKTEPIFIFKKG